jgi:hypothetical protein
VEQLKARKHALVAELVACKGQLRAKRSQRAAATISVRQCRERLRNQFIEQSVNQTNSLYRQGMESDLPASDIDSDVLEEGDAYDYFDN